MCMCTPYIVMLITSMFFQHLDIYIVANDKGDQFALKLHR